MKVDDAITLGWRLGQPKVLYEGFGTPGPWRRSLTSQQNIANPAESDNVPGDLILLDGSRFRTSLYELKVIGQLPTAEELPYFILSGRGCYECDAIPSIYIHSPSDGPMKNESKQPRFPYPGRLRDNERDQLVYESRMFYGSCLPNHPNAVVWFERGLGDDNKWHDGIQVAAVKDDQLVRTETEINLRKSLTPNLQFAMADATTFPELTATRSHDPFVEVNDDYTDHGSVPTISSGTPNENLIVTPTQDVRFHLNN
jgi:hypothetical protein